MWDEKYFIDCCAPFGAASSPGVFGHIADALVALYKAGGWTAVKKWVDDFLFFRYPHNTGGSSLSYSQSLNDIYSLTEPLGWPWKSSKTRPFANTFLYLGFLWNISERTVELPENKSSKFIEKLATWLPGHKASCKEAESLLGTLVHCSLAMPDSRSRLPSFSRFASSFQKLKSHFIKLSIPSDTLEDTEWWRSILFQRKCCSKLQRPPPICNITLAVDASTSFGIDVLVDEFWESWELATGWSTDGRNIGWAKMMAVELGLRCLVHRGFKNCHFRLLSDNMGVIHCLDGGCSRSVQQNRVLQRIVSLLRMNDLWITPEYVESSHNLADRPSRGLPCLIGKKLPPSLSPPLSYPLSSYLSRAV